MSLAANDLFTDEENQILSSISAAINEINRLKSGKNEAELPENRQRVKDLLTEKKGLVQRLAALIQQHKGTPRTVRLQNVLDLSKFRDAEGNLHLPPGVTWWTLRRSHMIAEFASEESRAMGLGSNDITFDKVIMTWKSLDMLEQVVKDGFYMPILLDDGTVLNKKYRFHTASAGQRLAC